MSAGHIRQRSPGSFELRYSLGTDPATGKRKVATTTVRGTRKDAERELRRLLRTVDTGEHVHPNRLTVRHWLEQWLAIVKSEVSLQTHESYTQIVNNRLSPAFGYRLLGKLSSRISRRLTLNGPKAGGRMVKTVPWRRNPDGSFIAC